MTDAEDLDYTHFTNQHNSTRHFPKSESSYKGKKNVYGKVEDLFKYSYYGGTIKYCLIDH